VVDLRGGEERPPRRRRPLGLVGEGGEGELLERGVVGAIGGAERHADDDARGRAGDREDLQAALEIAADDRGQAELEVADGVAGPDAVAAAAAGEGEGDDAERGRDDPPRRRPASPSQGPAPPHSVAPPAAPPAGSGRARTTTRRPRRRTSRTRPATAAASTRRARPRSSSSQSTAPTVARYEARVAARLIDDSIAARWRSSTSRAAPSISASSIEPAAKRPRSSSIAAA